MTEQPVEVEVMKSPDAKSSETLAVARISSQEIAPAGLFGTQEPVAIIEKATGVATALKAVITQQGLISRISGKDYPKCEAWTLLGTMLGVFPVLCWSRPVDGGWEARVEARTKDGAIVGAAEAECLRTERNWKDRDDFALRSMAQTRATAKCLRMPLGFVMTLAGYEVTPAEEMVSDHPRKPENAPGRAGTPKPIPPPTPPPKPSPAPQSAPNPPIPFPTDESRQKMIEALKARAGEPNRGIVTEYFRKLSDPTPLAPFEQLEELGLRFVPGTKGQMKALAEKIAEFGNGDRIGWAFPPHPDPKAPTVPGVTTPAQVVPKVVQEAADKAKDPEWWKKVIVPIPHKGEKRDAYLKHPDTLGSLYELRHGQDDEAQAARQRLWGIVENHSEAKPWTGRDDREHPPSATDIAFAEAVRAFKAWWDINHPDEKL